MRSDQAHAREEHNPFRHQTGERDVSDEKEFQRQTHRLWSGDQTGSQRDRQDIHGDRRVRRSRNSRKRTGRILHGHVGRGRPLLRPVRILSFTTILKYYTRFYFSLSGLSPFAGENDVETLKNVKACDWDFDEETFAIVSDEGKDFIRRLLIKNKEWVSVIRLYKLYTAYAQLKNVHFSRGLFENSPFSIYSSYFVEKICRPFSNCFSVIRNIIFLFCFYSIHNYSKITKIN